MNGRLTDLALRHATLGLFAAAVLLFGLAAPGFLGGENLANIVKQSAFIGIAALGMTFVLLTAGIDLSVGSVMYLAPLLAGLAMQATGGGVAVGLATAVLSGLAMGAINAFFVVRLAVIPFVVTLATLFCFRGFGAWLTQSRAYDFDAATLAFGQSSLLGVPMPILVFALVALAAHVTLSRTEFGRQVYAVGADAEAARKAGIRVGWVKARVYMLCSAAAGLAGFVLIAQIGRLDAGFGEGREFDVIAAAVLGGVSLFGGVGAAGAAILGATLVQTVRTGLVFTGVNLYLQPMALGLIIFAAVLVDSLRRARMTRRARRTIRPLGADRGGAP